MAEAQRKKGRRPKRQREEDEEGATSNGDNNNDGSCRELSTTTRESTNSVSVAKRNDNVDNPLLNNNQPTFPSINNNDGNNNENENNNNLPAPHFNNNETVSKGETVLDQEDYDDNLICPPAPKKGRYIRVRKKDALLEHLKSEQQLNNNENNSSNDTNSNSINVLQPTNSSNENVNNNGGVQDGIESSADQQQTKVSTSWSSYMPSLSSLNPVGWLKKLSTKENNVENESVNNVDNVGENDGDASIDSSTDGDGIINDLEGSSSSEGEVDIVPNGEVGGDPSFYQWNWDEADVDIQSSKQEYKVLSDNWDHQQYEQCNESRGTKRRLDIMLEHNSLPVSPKNKELTRWAVRQCGDEVHRDVIHDAVEKSDGTCKGVMDYLNGRRSKFVVVESTRQTSFNPLSAVVLPVSTANQFGALSSASDTTDEVVEAEEVVDGVSVFVLCIFEMIITYHLNRTLLIILPLYFATIQSRVLHLMMRLCLMVL